MRRNTRRGYRPLLNEEPFNSGEVNIDLTYLVNEFVAENQRDMTRLAESIAGSSSSSALVHSVEGLWVYALRHTARAIAEVVRLAVFDTIDPRTGLDFSERPICSPIIRTREDGLMFDLANIPSPTLRTSPDADHHFSGRGDPLTRALSVSLSRANGDGDYNSTVKRYQYARSNYMSRCQELLNSELSQTYLGVAINLDEIHQGVGIHSYGDGGNEVDVAWEVELTYLPSRMSPRTVVSPEMEVMIDNDPLNDHTLYRVLPDHTGRRHDDSIRAALAAKTRYVGLTSAILTVTWTVNYAPDDDWKEVSPCEINRYI
jgi:hypothetical protein